MSETPEDSEKTHHQHGLLFHLLFTFRPRLRKRLWDEEKPRLSHHLGLLLKRRKSRSISAEAPVAQEPMNLIRKPRIHKIYDSTIGIFLLMARFLIRVDKIKEVQQILPHGPVPISLKKATRKGKDEIVEDFSGIRTFFTVMARRPKKTEDRIPKFHGVKLFARRRKDPAPTLNWLSFYLRERKQKILEAAGHFLVRFNGKRLR